MKNYLIIGDGKLADHLKHYLSLLEIPFGSWSRRDNDETLENFSQEYKTVLLAISDSALAEVSKPLKNKTLVHFSGCLVLPGIHSAHPLMTFTKSLYDLDFYQNIPFICEEEKKSFKEIFPELNNPSYQIPGKDKDMYHALCVMSGNFTSLLWKKYFEDMQKKFQIPVEALFPYLNGIIKNIQTDYSNALTGPLARGDKDVILKHQLALKNDPYHSVYSGFLKTYQQIQET